MLRNNYIRLIYVLLFGAIILLFVFRPAPKLTVSEKKVGEIVYANDFWLKVLRVSEQLGNITQIKLALRNVTNKPILFCVTSPDNKADDSQFKKYYFVIERDGKVYSSCCKNYLVEPGIESGRFDRECRIYFDGTLTGSENSFLIISEDVAGENQIARVKLTESFSN